MCFQTNHFKMEWLTVLDLVPSRGLGNQSKMCLPLVFPSIDVGGGRTLESFLASLRSSVNAGRSQCKHFLSSSCLGRHGGSPLMKNLFLLVVSILVGPSDESCSELVWFCILESGPPSWIWLPLFCFLCLISLHSWHRWFWNNMWKPTGVLSLTSLDLLRLQKG